MRDADVCIFNQLLFLKDSGGILRHFLKKRIYFCAHHFCTESFNLSVPWPLESFFWRLQSYFFELYIQNNHCEMQCDSWLCECVCNCTRVCPGAHAHASLDMQSGSLVLSEGFSSIWPRPVSPAVAFQQQFQGQTCAPSLHTHAAKKTRESKERVCLAKFHVISVSRVTLLRPRGLTWDGCCSHPPRLIASPHSVISKSPPFLIPNHPSLFAYLHLPAHCYSLLLAAPFLVHCIMFMWYAFHFFISVIHYRLPSPNPSI